MQAHAITLPYWEQGVEAAAPYWKQAVDLSEPHRTQAAEVLTVCRGKFDESVGVAAGEVCLQNSKKIELVKCSRNCCFFY